MRKPVLYENALFHTGRTQEETFSYLLAQDGRITGLTRERPKKGTFGRVVDLGGGHAYPTLIDGHTHLMYTIVMAAAGFDVCTLESGGVEPHTLAGVEKKLRAFAAGKKKHAIVTANSYIMSAIEERRLPTREELDDWGGGRPVVVYTIDGHASALSTAMLDKLGIASAGHSGVLTGEAHERIQGRLTDLIASEVTPSLLARGIANVENACAAYGITHVGALEGNGDSPRDPVTYLMVQLARRMRLRVRIYFQYIDVKRAERYRKYQLHPRIGGCGDWEMDGACGAHSAAFDAPYRDTGETSPCYYTQEFIDARVREADEKGYQIASHAIGDAAICRIAAALNGTESGRFHRVEHGEFPSDEAFSAYQSGRFAVMMQPGYAWIDKRYLHTYEQYLPDETLRLLRFGSLIKAGVCVCGSSDSPVQELDPYLQMLGMVQFFRPEESVTPYQAFCCYTKNPARALGEEADIGTLEVGKEASFFVADRDFFTLAPHEVAAFRPRQTYDRGKPWNMRRGTLLSLLVMMLRRPHKI